MDFSKFNKIYRNTCQLNKSAKSNTQLFSMEIFAFPVLLDSFENLHRLISLHYWLKWIYFLNLHWVIKNIFLHMTKRALTSLSFMTGLRNGHEAEASKLIGFKFDYLKKTKNIYVDTHTSTHISTLFLK